MASAPRHVVAPVAGRIARRSCPFGHAVAGPLPQAAEKLVAAAQIANAGLAACESSRSKALYNCIADVLDRMSNDLSAIRRGVPNTQSALRTAASRLRAATTKAEALSAVTQCQAVIAGALRQVQAAGANGRAQGWDDSGLAAVAGVLARAARLIQTTG